LFRKKGRSYRSANRDAGCVCLRSKGLRFDHIATNYSSNQRSTLGGPSTCRALHVESRGSSTKGSGHSRTS
jgi:hypothetical protein